MMIVVFWDFFLCRLLTVSLPCFLVLRVECKWQRPSEVSSTYPENRYLKPLVTLDFFDDLLDPHPKSLHIV